MYKVLIVLIFIFKLCLTIDPLTGLGLISLGSAVGFNFGFVKKYTFCKLSECCINDHIPTNFDGLEKDLRDNLYGQHIVIDTTLTALKAHYNNIEKSKKPLVLTFHGTTGTGKNYVADFIAKNLYKYGLDSGFVHKFIGRLDFPEERQVDKYKSIVKETVISIVSKCPRALFIFDEIDKTPAGVLDSLTPLMDHHNSINGVNYRQAVFIFLTNTAGVEIGNTLAKILRSGKLRTESSLKDFEQVCQVGAFNLPGGLQKAGAIEASLIDHYIPFLPLERYHIEQCVKAEFLRLERFCDSTDLEMIAGEIPMEESTGLFATAGCKRIDKQVGARIEMNKLERR